MRTPADKGEGVKIWKNLAEVFYGWPLKSFSHLCSYALFRSRLGITDGGHFNHQHFNH